MNYYFGPMPFWNITPGQMNSCPRASLNCVLNMPLLTADRFGTVTVSAHPHPHSRLSKCICDSNNSVNLDTANLYLH